MTTKEVKVALRAEAKGFGQAHKEVKQTFDAMKGGADAAKNIQKLDYYVGQAARQFKGLAAGVKDLNQLLRQRDGIQNTAALRKEVEALTAQVEKLTNAKKRAANTEYGGISPSADRPTAESPAAPPESPDEEKRKRKQRNRVSFARGVFQGAGMGEYYPDDNIGGMVRQAAGRKLGEFGRGLISSPFTGAQGFSTMLGSIPIAGGFLQGQMNNAMGAAGDALNYRRSIEQTLPGMMDAGTYREALEKAGNTPISRRELARRTGQYGGSTEDAITAIVGERAGGDVTSARRGFANSLSAAGMEYGVAHQEQALQYGAQYGQMTGQTSRTMNMDDFRASLAAQNLGMGLDTSAALTRGRNMGGMRNGTGVEQGSTASILSRLAASAEALGMQGSDRDRYMREMASAVLNWDKTGIPVNFEGQNGMQSFLSGGMSPQRAQHVASQLQNSIQSVGMQGPQSGLDFAMLQDFGGYSGGGLDDFIDAAEKMQGGGDGVSNARGLDKLINRARNAPMSKKGQSWLLSGWLQDRGISMGSQEARESLLDAGSAEEAFTNFTKKRDASTFDVLAAGRSTIDQSRFGSDRSDAARLTAGEPLIQSMRNFQDIQTEMLSDFGKFSTEINFVTDKMKEGAKEVRVIADTVRSVLTKIEAWAGHLPNAGH